MRGNVEKWAEQRIMSFNYDESDNEKEMIGTEAPLHFGALLDERNFREIQNRLALDNFKWDIQVGDTSTLFRQPLFISAENWRLLTQIAQELAAELMAAEHEIHARPDLYPVLGLPRQLHSVLTKSQREELPTTVRSMRFDFHYTTEGWRISEVNSDVPGGYTEGSCFTQLVAHLSPEGTPAGDPARAWAAAMMAVAGTRGRVALLSAPGFLEDQQVTAFLSRELQVRGMETFLLHDPSQLHWKGGRARVLYKGAQLSVDAVVRFYQGEWLAKLPKSTGWEHLFTSNETPVTNPGAAMLTESKRFALTWPHIESGITRWRSLLPECCDPGDELWKTNENHWVLKKVFSNTGDEVHMLAGGGSWQALKRVVLRNRERWVVQRKFETCPVGSHVGPVYPCLGVYTINGEAAGAYVRVGKHPVIDYRAMDVALLISEHRHE